MSEERRFIAMKPEIGFLRVDKDGYFEQFTPDPEAFAVFKESFMVVPMSLGTESIPDLRESYGRKWNAITAALGYATAASDHFVNGDEEQGIAALDAVVRILADA